MGCGLRKLEDPDDSSPGKIFSTLKRPQVETKTEFAYEYVLLDFTLQASSNPEVIKINSILDIVTKVEDYYLKGYIVGAIHPVIQPVGQRKHLPASYLYRAVLSRLKLSLKHSAAPNGQRRPKLVIEECPLTHETQTNDVAKELIEKINVAAKRGMKFVGFVSQHYTPSKFCNGTNYDGDIESTLHVTYCSDENCKSWSEGTLSGQSSESGIEEELHHESGQCQVEQNCSPSSSKSRKGEDNKLYIVFNVFDDDSTCWTYQEGILSMKVTRKGSVISTLDADWLELTTFYYKQGLSLIDSFVCWETSKGPLPHPLGSRRLLQRIQSPVAEEKEAPSPRAIHHPAGHGRGSESVAAVASREDKGIAVSAATPAAAVFACSCSPGCSGTLPELTFGLKSRKEVLD
ncbi:PREDICTED: raftlin-2 [Galeopterus variegatus]|uniref:Raftlin-2 n=1 Tax=Galeopterus variegatus TaxID=482537 RepID=A0ABM0RYF2_GALVR|nr:PREDICTED: raftlin-2 [Galeopterus variegatus]